MADKKLEQDKALERELAGLKQEYEKLHEKKIQTKADLANLERQLKDLEAQAKETYGTADPDELEKLLQEKRAENARLVSEYREHIHSVNAELGAIEVQEGQ